MNEPLLRMSRDMAKAAATLSDQEARFLVSRYYAMQDDRKRLHSQAQALSKSGEPHSVFQYLAESAEVLENQCKRALDKYTEAHQMGAWMREVHGIGPVLSAGLLAHIDITRAPTVGHIWSFAGLNPETKWAKGQTRPWNAELKVLCWKIGQSFLKFSGDEKCYYGGVYRQRKAFEVANTEAGVHRDIALGLAAGVGKDTEAFGHYSAGRLPPAQLDARARRYAVKLFLSHMHGAWYELHYGKPAPLPYPIAHMQHVHFIPAPH